MKSFAKRTLLFVILVCFAVLASCLIVSCNKNNKLVSTEGLEYELIDNGEDYAFAVVGLGTATDENIVIPSTYKDKPVISIGNNAFKDRKLIKSVLIPDSVTSIGNAAFYNCTVLTSITIPNNVKHIGNLAFYGCVDLTSIYYNGSIAEWCGISGLGNLMSLTRTLYVNGEVLTGDLTIPDNVISIGGFAFYGCSGLTSITIPNNVKSIGSSAFSGCTGVTSITGSVASTSTVSKQCGASTFEVLITSGERIEDNAFKGCSNLTSVTIPDSVTSLGSSAFFGCSGLTSIAIPSSVTSIGDMAFARCSDLSTVIINDGIRQIGYGAFSQCTDLKDIILPESVTYIGALAFWGCKSLTNIRIPNSIVNVGLDTFGECSMLKYNKREDLNYLGNDNNPYVVLINVDNTSINSAIVDDNCRLIYYGAFHGCTELTSITLGNKLMRIGEEAFGNCYRLVEICNESNLELTVGDLNNNGCIAAHALNIYSQPSDSKLFVDENGNTFYCDGDEKTLINTSKFNGEVVLQEGVTKINDYAFYNRQELTSIHLPSTINEIGNYAFSLCPNISHIEGNCLSASFVAKQCGAHMYDVVINSGDSICDEAFANCVNMRSITIPNSVQSIGKKAFYRCSGLGSIDLVSISFIGENAFECCTGFTSVIVPDSVTEIGLGAFSGCNKLVSITLPFVGSSKKENSNASNQFGYVFGKTKYDGGLSIVQTYPFNKVGYITYYLPSTLRNVSITGRYMPYGAFSNCTMLTSISIPENTTYIDEKTFYNCTNLKTINVPSTVRSVGEDAFNGCNNLAYNIYDNAKYLGNDENPYVLLVGVVDRNISACEINNNCKVIGQYAFYNSHLKEISFPESVETIEESAFDMCYIVSIVMPNNFITIKSQAFSYCFNLKTVNFKGTISEWQSYYGTRFSNCDINCTDGTITK